MRFFDAHAHAQFAAYVADRDAVVRRALDAGVWMVNVGTQLDTSRAAVELAESCKEGVYATVGLHPIHTEKSFHDAQELGGGDGAKALASSAANHSSAAGAASDGKGGFLTGFTSRGESFSREAYLELARHPKTAAIGECGLDYYRLRDGGKEKQRDAFGAQISFAKEVGKPLMIHCRDAFGDLVAILNERRGDLNNPPGIIHFFAGGIEDAKKLLDLGFYFTFGGAITFPTKAGTPPYGELVKLVPMDRILSETDAPYVAPAPYRGKRNEPAYVIEVVKKLAEIKNVPMEEMAGQTFENAKRIFKV